MNNWYLYQRFLRESYPIRVAAKNGGYDIFAKGKWVAWFMGLLKPGTVHIVNGEAWIGPDESMAKTQEDWKKAHPESTWADFRCHLLMLGYEPMKLEQSECLYA